MVRERITVNDFERISKDNEYFIWHFVNPNSVTAVKSIFQTENPFNPNPLISILKLIPIPYFESDSQDSYDFLINLSEPFMVNAYRNNTYNPVMISFNRKRMVNHTFGPHCYCPEGIIELIGELNPKFILDAN
tara:strand:- start:1230 stop:1628 length:399 start_codon:yes stop_codon:yes gene_type:complete